MEKLTFMMEKPPPSTCSLSMARMTSSSVMGSAFDPRLLCKGAKHDIRAIRIITDLASGPNPYKQPEEKRSHHRPTQRRPSSLGQGLENTLRAELQCLDI